MPTQKALWLYTVTRLVSEVLPPQALSLQRETDWSELRFPSHDPLAFAAVGHREGDWQVGVWLDRQLAERWTFRWDDDDVFGWEPPVLPAVAMAALRHAVSALPLRISLRRFPAQHFPAWFTAPHPLENSVEFLATPEVIRFEGLSTPVGNLRVSAEVTPSAIVQRWIPGRSLVVAPLRAQLLDEPLHGLSLLSLESSSSHLESSSSHLESHVSSPQSPPSHLTSSHLSSSLSPSFIQSQSPPYLSLSSPPSYSLFPFSPPSPFDLSDSLSLAPSLVHSHSHSRSHSRSLSDDLNFTSSSAEMSPPPESPWEPRRLDFSSPSKTSDEHSKNFPAIPRPGTPTPIELPRSLARLPNRQQEFEASGKLPRRFLSQSAPSYSPLRSSLSSLSPPPSELSPFPSSSTPSAYLSPSELLGPFAGSFQESILSGRMANIPCSVFPGFTIDLGVCGNKSVVPPHRKISFDAKVYHVEHDTPYAATVTLDKKGYKIPPKGLIQLVVINPSQTPVKTFLVKYDLSDMPPLTKTFLRQRIVSSSPHVLRYAIQLKFVSPRKKKFYLYKNIRLVFAHRLPDETENLKISYDVPNDPKYFHYTTRSAAHHTSLRQSNQDEENPDNENKH